jgi:hypothetical protein
MLELFGKYAKTDFITDGDLKRISQKLDFLASIIILELLLRRVMMVF